MQCAHCAWCEMVMQCAHCAWCLTVMQCAHCAWCLTVMQCGLLIGDKQEAPSEQICAMEELVPWACRADIVFGDMFV
eukprot:1144663-Pelagomonas_calceolata.AAC.2